MLSSLWGYKRKIAAVGLSMVMATAVAGCGTFGQKMHTFGIFAMNTVMEFQVEGTEDRTGLVEETIRQLEKELSVTDPESDISRLNQSGSIDTDPLVSEAVSGALRVCERTDGALDITVYPVLRKWGFTTGEYRVPSEDEIDELLAYVDYSKVSVSGNEITIPKGYQVDLGSVAKGYAGSYAASVLRDNGVTHALLNLGGNVQCIGSKPGGDDWKIGIKSPFQDSDSGVFGMVSVSDKAVITSGGYERFFEENGEIYWHILDPHTGKPADSGLASVTIIGDDGLLCDGLSTGLFVLGLEQATGIWRQSEDFEAIFITEEGEAYVTEGIAGSFTLSPEYRDAPLHVITR